MRKVRGFRKQRAAGISWWQHKAVLANISACVWHKIPSLQSISYKMQFGTISLLIFEIFLGFQGIRFMSSHIIAWNKLAEEVNEKERHMILVFLLGFSPENKFHLSHLKQYYSMSPCPNPNMTNCLWKTFQYMWETYFLFSQMPFLLVEIPTIAMC